MDELQRAGRAPDRPDTVKPIPPPRRTAALHVAALAVLAFAQPLFDLIGRHGEFLVASRSGALELLVLVLLFVGIVPGALALAGFAAGRLGEAVRGWTHLGLVAFLLAVIALPVFGRLWNGAPALPLLAAALAGGGGAVAYHRVASIRLLVSVLAIGILVVPVSFLLNSDATKVLFPPAPAGSGRSVAAETPVVLLILDELPLASLLDERLEIDAARYPNFAALASTSTWYRNATTVSDGTVHAVPAILTGRYPRDGLLPTASDHPDNLFTLLGGSYDIQAQEPVTHLCPPQLCRAADGPARGSLAPFLADTTVVLGHAILPGPVAARLLPRVDQNWRGFTRAGRRLTETASRAARSPFEGPDHGAALAVPLSSAGRALFVVHLMLPHVPWRFLPEGHRYSRAHDIPGLGQDERWLDDPRAVQFGYQRHLLQLGYTDRVLGRLIGKLRAAGIYDDALVVVVSDHGASFRAGGSRRRASSDNWSDVLRVPFFIKFPGQVRPVVSDHPVETIDVLPTVADVLGVDLSFAVNGRSLLETLQPARARMALGYRTGRIITPSNDLSGLKETVERKVRLFGAGSDTRRLFGLGHANLVDQPLNQLPVVTSSQVAAVIDEPDRFADVHLESGVLPALISGSVFGPGIGQRHSVAVAVNGVIRAVSPLFVVGQGMRFRAIVPPASFRAGPNDVDILVAGKDSGRAPLTVARFASSQYVLISQGGTDRLLTATGAAVRLQPGAVKGFVDGWSVSDVNGYLSLAGWVADPGSQDPPAVLVFADDRFVAGAGPISPRPDVAKALDDDRALQSGFVIRVPSSELAGASRVRVFGVTAAGEATELTYGPGYPYKDARSPREPSSADRTAG